MPIEHLSIAIELQRDKKNGLDTSQLVAAFAARALSAVGNKELALQELARVQQVVHPKVGRISIRSI